MRRYVIKHNGLLTISTGFVHNGVRFAARNIIHTPVKAHRTIDTTTGDSRWEQVPSGESLLQVFEAYRHAVWKEQDLSIERYCNE